MEYIYIFEIENVDVAGGSDSSSLTYDDSVLSGVDELNKVLKEKNKRKEKEKIAKTPTTGDNDTPSPTDRET